MLDKIIHPKLEGLPVLYDQSS